MDKGGSSLEELLELMKGLIFKYAEIRGFKEERSKELLFDLVIAFMNSLTSEKIPEIEEWMNIAYRAKRIPVCRHSCLFSDDLERVLVSHRFREFHFKVINEKISKLKSKD